MSDAERYVPHTYFLEYTGSRWLVCREDSYGRRVYLVGTSTFGAVDLKEFAEGFLIRWGAEWVARRWAWHDWRRWRRLRRMEKKTKYVVNLGKLP